MVRRVIACLVVAATASVLSGAGPAAAGPIGYDATHTQTIDAGHSLNGVSCVPATTTCVAANSQGNALYATNVSATSAATWSSWSGPGTSPSWAIECPAITLCLLAADTVNGGGRIYRATSLGGTFLTSLSPGFGVRAISCASTSFCASAQGGGNIRFTSNPSAAFSWALTGVTGEGGDLQDVSCRSSSFCVEAGSQGYVYVATEEITDESPWTSTNVDGTTALRGVSCISTTSCLAVDGSGDVLHLAIDADGAATASRQPVDGADGLVAVDCTGTTCAVADSHGGIFASPNAGLDWIQRYSGGGGVTSVSCASASLCAAVTATGDVTTFTPESDVPPLVLTSGALPPGAVDAPYDAQVVQAAGGTPSYQWSATGLPPGLVIDQASGEISGTPMTAVCVQAPCPQPAATYTPTITVTDSHGTQASSPLTIALAARISALKVTTTGGGSGAVDSSPAGITACGTSAGACEASYDDGTVVTLIAHPAAGSEFTGWSEGCSGAGACQVTVGAGTTPTARFEKAPPAGPGPPANPGPPTDPGPPIPPPPPVRAHLLIKHLGATSVRTRCAVGSATVARSHRRVCTKLAITVEGTIAKEARGTVSIKLSARVHGRSKTLTQRARILNGRWQLRILLSGVAHTPKATISVSTRFAGSTGVGSDQATRRVRVP
ncbi:Ig domain-containing protein [Baekduia sp.]|uniref:Ig domain-containing protein n=1 Tax=Baekduia sp. TaxID=2600305 RepID=UPI002DF73DEA|nr:Ig domain-containing protein [Baekduia sp.]